MTKPAGALPRRPYGRERIPLSIVGLGGIVVMDSEQPQVNRVVAEAVERGVNYVDVAPTYGDAEIKLGPALQPYRKNAFLACKTTERRREGAAAELARSLERLRTDHLELYQLHGLTDLKTDVDAAFSGGGAMEVLIEAKKDGRVRHLGFSAHSVEAALSAMDRFDFDSVLIPVNFVCDFRGGFARRVIEAAQSKGATVLALKAIARQRWPEGSERKPFAKCWYQPLADPRVAALALRYTLNQPVAATLPPGEEALFRLVLDLACGDLHPLTEAEAGELRALADAQNPIFSAGSATG